jgi:RNA polymerase primary sigma factor
VTHRKIAEAGLIKVYQEAIRAREMTDDVEEREDLPKLIDRVGARIITPLESQIDFITNKYNRRTPNHVLHSDIKSAAYLGLVEAMTRFDSSKGYRLVTYARQWIDNRIHEHIRHDKWLMCIPERIYKHLSKLIKEQERFIHEYKRDPEIEEMAKIMNSTPSQIIRVCAWTHRDALSLDSPQGKYGEISGKDQLQNRDNKDMNLGDPEAGVLASLSGENVNRVLRTINAQERRVIELRLGLDDTEAMTPREIAEVLGVSTQVIRRVEAKALQKLRHPSRTRLLERPQWAGVRSV